MVMVPPAPPPARFANISDVQAGESLPAAEAGAPAPPQLTPAPFVAPPQIGAVECVKAPRVDDANVVGLIGHGGGTAGPDGRWCPIGRLQ